MIRQAVELCVHTTTRKRGLLCGVALRVEAAKNYQVLSIPKVSTALRQPPYPAYSINACCTCAGKKSTPRPRGETTASVSSFHVIIGQRAVVAPPFQATTRKGPFNRHGTLELVSVGRSVGRSAFQQENRSRPLWSEHCWVIMQDARALLLPERLAAWDYGRRRARRTESVSPSLVASSIARAAFSSFALPLPFPELAACWATTRRPHETRLDVLQEMRGDDTR